MQRPKTEMKVNLLKIGLIQLVKSHQENLFLAGFIHQEPRLLRHFAALPCMYANTRRRQVAIKSEKKPFGNSNQLKCIQHLKRLGMQNQ